MEVTYLGYSPATETIDINGDLQKDFSLSPAVVENQGVTVTGVSGATQIKKTPTPITIIRKEYLLREASTNLIDALSKTPGVSQVSTGPAISKPSIRGLGYNSVVVINDGIRQEGQQWGDEHGIEVDEYSVNKAEILKGPASIMYGSDALAGVVNFISVLPPPEGMIKGNIFSNYQTNNRLEGFSWRYWRQPQWVYLGIEWYLIKPQPIIRINMMAMFSIPSSMKRISALISD